MHLFSTCAQTEHFYSRVGTGMAWQHPLSKTYLRCKVNNSYHSWAEPLRLFLVWKPELNRNFEANCTVSMANSSASVLSFSLLTYGELAFMIFRMNWKYSCVYWLRWWRKRTFCFWIERSIGAGIFIFLFSVLLPLPEKLNKYFLFFKSQSTIILNTRKTFYNIINPLL